MKTLVARRLVKRDLLVLQTGEVTEGVMLVEGQVNIRFYIAHAVQITRLGSIHLRKLLLEGFWVSVWTDSSTVEPAVTLVEAGVASIVVVEASTIIATIVTGAVSVAVSAGLMIPPRIMAGGEQVGHRVDAVMLWRLIFHLGDVRRTDGVLPRRTRWVTWRVARPTWHVR